MNNVACLRCPDASRCFKEGHCYMLEPASITPPPPRAFAVDWKAPKAQDNSYPASVMTPHGFGCVVRPLPVTMEPDAPAAFDNWDLVLLQLMDDCIDESTEGDGEQADAAREALKMHMRGERPARGYVHPSGK